MKQIFESLTASGWMSATETYYTCPRCDYFSNARLQENYCSNCGARLLTECSRCRGAISNPYAKFCSSCGGRLKEAAAITEQR